MASTPVLNASSTLSQILSPLYPPQPTLSQFDGFNQSQWGPDAIGTIFFGVVMFLIGVTALWQGRRGIMRREEGTSGSPIIFAPADKVLDEEQGQRTPVGGRPVDRVNEVAMVDLPAEGSGSARVAAGVDGNIHRDDIMEEQDGFVKIERGMRTDTEGTLVGCDDDEGEVEKKEFDD